MAELLIQPSLASDPNAVALARLPERITDLDVNPLIIYDLDKVAASALPYLAEQFNLAGPLWEHLQGEAAQRQAIRRAIAWHRDKGTPWAITEALSWIGVNATPDDLRSMSTQWAAYELRLDSPPQPSQLPLILSLAQFAAPARAHLVRFYSVENDVRPIVLDRAPPLDTGMLDGDSGVMGPDGVKLSFGERSGATLPAAPADALPAISTQQRVGLIRYDDMPVLDAWRLDSHVLMGGSGGVMELFLGTTTAHTPGGGAMAMTEARTSVAPWVSPAPVAAGGAAHISTAPEPISPPRRWGGPWGGPWRQAFLLIQSEET